MCEIRGKAKVISTARKLALKSNRKQRHSALILCSGNLVAAANNTRGHAEQIAIKKSLQKYDIKVEENSLKGFTLISFRLTPKGGLGNSRPCRGCSIHMAYTGIRRVIYFDGKKWVEEFR